VSRIKAFLSCKNQYNLNYNKQIKHNFASPDAEKGTATHYIAENYSDHKDYTFNDWVEKLKVHEHFGKKLDLSSISMEDLEMGFENIKVFWKDFVEKFYSKEEIFKEDKIEFLIDNETFQGTLDLTLKNSNFPEDGQKTKYTILDYKSTKSGGSGAEHALQLSTYVMAAHKKYEPQMSLKDFSKITKVAVYYPYTNFKSSTLENLKIVNLEYSDIDESKDTLLNAISAIEEEKNWLSTVHFGCRWCGYAGSGWCPSSRVKGYMKTRGTKFFKSGIEISDS